MNLLDDMLRLARGEVDDPAEAARIRAMADEMMREEPIEPRFLADTRRRARAAIRFATPDRPEALLPEAPVGASTELSFGDATATLTKTGDGAEVVYRMTGLAEPTRIAALSFATDLARYSVRPPTRLKLPAAAAFAADAKVGRPEHVSENERIIARIDPAGNYYVDAVDATGTELFDDLVVVELRDAAGTLIESRGFALNEPGKGSTLRGRVRLSAKADGGTLVLRDVSLADFRVGVSRPLTAMDVELIATDAGEVVGPDVLFRFPAGELAEARATDGYWVAHWIEEGS